MKYYPHKLNEIDIKQKRQSKLPSIIILIFSLLRGNVVINFGKNTPRCKLIFES